MRFRSAILIALLLALAPGSREAQAAPSIDIIWVSTTGSGTPGGASIDAAPGDTLVAEIQIFPDAPGVGGYEVSLEFDTDLGDELDLVNVTEFLPGVMEYNLSPGVDGHQESTLAQKGTVAGIEAVTVTIMGPTSGTIVAAQVTFKVGANVSSDSADVFVGIFNGDDDVVFDNASDIVTPIFSNAEVNLAGSPVPSLSTPAAVVVSLLLSLAALWTLRRRWRVQPD